MNFLRTARIIQTIKMASGENPPRKNKWQHELSTREQPKKDFPQDYMDKVLEEIQMRLKLQEELSLRKKSLKHNKEEPPELDEQDLNPKHKEFLAKLPTPINFVNQVKQFVDYMVVTKEFNKLEEFKKSERIKYLNEDMKILNELI